MSTTLSPPPAIEPLNRTRLWSALGAVYILWGSTYLFIHFMTEQMPPLYMASVRYIVAGSLLYGVARFTGTARPTWPEWRSTIIIGFLLLTVANGCLAMGIQYIPSGMAALLGGLLPIYLLLLNWVSFGRKRPSVLALLGLVFGLAGIYLLIAPEKMVSAGGMHANLIGTCLIAVGNFSWAVGTLLTPRLPQPAQTLASGMQMLCGGLILLLLSLLLEPVTPWSILAAPTKAVWSMVYLVVFGSIIGFSAYAWLARNAPPTLLSTYAFVNPVVALLLGITFAGEFFSVQSLAGAGVALLGVVFITLGRK